MNPIAQYILFGVSILGTAIALYRSIREPDEKADKSIGLLTLQLNEIKSNHLHTLDLKMDRMETQVTSMRMDLTKVNTILEERLPKKQ